MKMRIIFHFQKLRIQWIENKTSIKRRDFIIKNVFNIPAKTLFCFFRYNKGRYIWLKSKSNYTKIVSFSLKEVPPPVTDWFIARTCISCSNKVFSDKFQSSSEENISTLNVLLIWSFLFFACKNTVTNKGSRKKKFSS